MVECGLHRFPLFYKFGYALYSTSKKANQLDLKDFLMIFSLKSCVWKSVDISRY